MGSFEEGPPNRERSLLPNPFRSGPFGQGDMPGLTERDSSAPPGETKKRTAKQQTTSSYWRVNEMEMFPKYLQAFGKNWTKIAEEMGTKTAQQVYHVRA